jgi:hypothetical protein
MTGLFLQDGFVRSEAWLTDGPTPPDSVVEALRARCPRDLLDRNPETGVVAAVIACRSARADGLASSMDWRAACSKSYTRIGRGQEGHLG